MKLLTNDYGEEGFARILLAHCLSPISQLVPAPRPNDLVQLFAVEWEPMLESAYPACPFHNERLLGDTIRLRLVLICRQVEWHRLHLNRFPLCLRDLIPTSGHAKDEVQAVLVIEAHEAPSLEMLPSYVAATDAKPVYNILRAMRPTE